MKILTRFLPTKSFSFSISWIFVLLLFFMSLLMIGCDTLKLTSNWREKEISIDGNSKDWLGDLLYIEKENISLGLLNDEDFMYVCLLAENQFLRAQIMRMGLTLWFDPHGGNEKKFGIRFPLGRLEKGEPIGMEEELPNPGMFKEKFEESLNELEILGPGKDDLQKIPLSEIKGIVIQVEASSGLLVYELKIPLMKSESHPYAIGTEPGKVIGVGLETPKPQIDQEMMKKRMGGGRPEGMGMPPGGRPGGFGMPGERPTLEPLKLWAQVQLASHNNPGQK